MSLTSGFHSRFLFARYFLEKLKCCCLCDMLNIFLIRNRKRKTHTYKNPFFWMTQISMIPPGLCGVFLHCCSTCANSLFIGKKPQTSTCACSGAELDYDATVHALALLPASLWMLCYTSDTSEKYNLPFEDTITENSLLLSMFQCSGNRFYWDTGDSVRNNQICIRNLKEDNNFQE